MLKRKKAKSRKRRYFGETVAKPLLEWLYDPTTTEEQRNVVLQLISLGRETRDSRNPLERELLKGKVNDILVDMKFNPQVIAVKGVWTVIWEAEEYGSAADAVRLWLELISLGLWARLKQCAYKKCRRWFFAKFAHASFHSTECRDANATADTERREKRRAYERRYYRNNSPIWK